MIIIHYHKVPVKEVEERVLARLAKEDREITVIEKASHIYPDASFGVTLSQVHDKFLAIIRDLEAMPSIEVQFEKVTRTFDFFWYRVKLKFDARAEKEVREALSDNDIEIKDEIE